MNHAAEDSNIGKLDSDYLILVSKVGNGNGNGLSQFLFHDTKTFGLVLLVDTGGWKFSWK
jgi:hypothetical protein